MLGELLIENRREEVRLDEAARGDVEGRGRLRDRLAGPAREALAQEVSISPTIGPAAPKGTLLTTACEVLPEWITPMFEDRKRSG